MKKSVSRFVPLLILCSLLVSLPQINIAKAGPKTIIVPNDYPTIEWAIGNATEDDTIFVKKGTYYNQSFNIDKSLSLVGEDSRTTILRGNFPPLIGPGYPPYTTVVQVNADDIKISGFTITNALIGIRGNGNKTQIIGNNILDIYDKAISLSGFYNTIAGNNIKDALYCITCTGSFNIIDANNIVDAHNEGITLNGPSNRISGNNITGIYFPYGYGIRVDGDLNTITKNNLLNGAIGIQLKTGSRNIVSGNNIRGNWFMGINLHTTSNNVIYENYIANNTHPSHDGYGVSLSGRGYRAENNTFYRNNIINNSYNIRIESPYYVNIWDNGREGNYWSNYAGTDNDKDGIGDTPYVIDANNQDRYPLMEPVVIPEFPDTTPPTISVVSPQNKTYTANNVSLTLTISEQASWIGYSLDGQANVTIAGNTTITGLSEASHNLTVYANDTYGNTGTSETIYFSIAQPSEPQKSEPFPTAWIVVAIVITLVVGAALLVYFRKIRKTTFKTETPATLAQRENWVYFPHE